MIFFNQDQKDKIRFEELHIRHLNLLIDLKNIKFNNWFYKMAIINTFDDIKVFLKNLELNKNKCIIAIHNRKIISYIYTYPLNEKKTCLRINTPQFIEDFSILSERKLVFELIKKSISYSGFKSSSFIINANLENEKLISSARELGFQPLDEIKLWINNEYNPESSNYKTLDKYEEINNSNIKNVLNFVRSNQCIPIREILDFNQLDVFKRCDENCGAIILDKEVIFTLLKENNYFPEKIYSLIKAIYWDERLIPFLKVILENLFISDPDAILRTKSNDDKLNYYLKNNNLKEVGKEIILIRNSLIKSESKSANKINKSLESIFEKINPPNNPFPAPLPLK